MHRNSPLSPFHMQVSRFWRHFTVLAQLAIKARCKCRLHLFVLRSVVPFHAMLPSAFVPRGRLPQLTLRGTEGKTPGVFLPALCPASAAVYDSLHLPLQFTVFRTSRGRARRLPVSWLCERRARPGVWPWLSSACTQTDTRTRNNPSQLHSQHPPLLMSLASSWLPAREFAKAPISIL